MTWDAEQDPRPEEPDDEYRDFLWPDDDEKDDNGPDDDWPEEGGRPAPVRAGVPEDVPVPWQWGVPPAIAGARVAGERRRRILTLAITGVVAVGLGAGAVLVYRSTLAGAMPAAAASPGTGQAPGQGGGQAGPGGGQAGQRAVTEMQVLARVTAVRSGTITFGGGPMQSVTAAVTSATRFTGSVRTLAGVSVGDTVAAQIMIDNGVAKVVTLQDPAGES